ncbi:MAG: arginine--tRNA ligase [Betaproteobacteria bacterium]|jgi:arginyl-tRNA synthetase|nr:arginine--tRNA ligase [Rhodocyclaceae bacterium]MCA3134036.1 arginine--tRNA ligase [Rhodocyclaceae bacterium]MCA3142672.1 arginine--tRNA ligase [Rhodocyclaceae bacterium]MCA3144421.1 arginine--tRNA ligase [Rhodocyclaceae bacterium]MCE2897485.1 arginine--tRNA ligase [Betaproteobacteria bacterium]
MSQAPIAELKAHLAGLVATSIEVVTPEARGIPVSLERPKSGAHGDYACNVAMHAARLLKRNPREIATLIRDQLPDSDVVERVDIAGAGFLNFHLRPAARQAVVRRVLAQGAGYGRSTLGAGRRVQVEFVSANPTGPLHVGHGRGAAYGASLANVLEASGFDVQREYYVNDAGRQMDILAVSSWLRYLELCGEALPFPANGYQGDYVRTRAAEFKAVEGERLRHAAEAVLSGLPEAVQGDEAALEARMDALIERARQLLGSGFGQLARFVLDRQLEEIRQVLGRFGVRFDMWYSERSLHESGRVAQALETLERSGHLYLQDGALWFRSTAFGDDKDRVVRRDNGQFTYFASDIAYHFDKLERGFDLVIDVWGADHHGYIPRVKAAIAAFGQDPERLVVPLIQLVALYRGGEPVRMGKRSGSYVTLEELFEEAGVDATRFFYLGRKCDQHLDFDIDLARAQSADNPVYYVQYAHARVAGVLAQWGGDPAALAAVDLGRLEDGRETALLARLMDYPDVIELAARDFAPHAVAFYLRELAGEFHGYYNATRLLVEDAGLREARLALVAAAQQVLRNGLSILGLSAPEKM